MPLGVRKLAPPVEVTLAFKVTEFTVTSDAPEASTVGDPMVTKSLVGETPRPPEFVPRKR